jgi:hypothetical protein
MGRTINSAGSPDKWTGYAAKVRADWTCGLAAGPGSSVGLRRCPLRLTIRHDAGMSAAPYVSGTLLGVRLVFGRTGLTRGLDTLLMEREG